jgi:hypothetical protein
MTSRPKTASLPADGLVPAALIVSIGLPMTLPCHVWDAEATLPVPGLARLSRIGINCDEL